jgi:hypothetical protein
MQWNSKTLNALMRELKRTIASKVAEILEM